MVCHFLNLGLLYSAPLPLSFLGSFLYSIEKFNPYFQKQSLVCTVACSKGLPRTFMKKTDWESGVDLDGLKTNTQLFRVLSTLATATFLGFPGSPSLYKMVTSSSLLSPLRSCSQGQCSMWLPP